MVIGETMEKYCKQCGRVFDDLNFKLCPYCGSELATRYGRQPIPRKLRHEVFKRDGYRCRECGASKDETSLEIDHIVPVARGGTNDIGNLQTLCRECNRMKHTDTWVGGETDLETVKHELDSLNNQINNVKNNLSQANNENDKIEYKYQLMKLEERLTIVEKQYGKLSMENKQFEAEREKEEKINQLYKKLYVQLSDNELVMLSDNYGINYDNRNKIIRFLVNKYSEKEIYDVLAREKAKMKGESIVVTGEVKCLGGGRYRYTYKTSDGKNGSINGSSIEDLKIKSRQYKIQWNPK